MDLGFTLSSRPQVAVYGCAFGLGGLGYGNLDGKVLGLFGGKVGMQDVSANIWGAGPVGGETIQVGDAAPQKKCTGAVCIVRRAPEGTTKSSSCCHYLHLGFIGMAGNLHYKEILDWTLGFAGVDICNDDQSRLRPAVASAPEKEDVLSPTYLMPDAESTTGPQAAISADAMPGT